MNCALIRFGAVLFSISCLTGCTSEQTADQLRAQLHLVRQQTSIAPPSDVTVRHVSPFPYEHAGDHTPFGTPASTDADIERRPAQRGPMQYLEQFSLDAIRLVGTIAGDGKTEAWIETNGVVHRVRTGDYLGQQFGIVRHITEDGVELEELVSSGDHDWEIRPATLTMQGGQ